MSDDIPAIGMLQYKPRRRKKGRQAMSRKGQTDVSWVVMANDNGVQEDDWWEVGTYATREHAITRAREAVGDAKRLDIARVCNLIRETTTREIVEKWR
jgi:hypothetical protein